MKFTKAFFHTILYYFLVILIQSWILLIPIDIDISWLYPFIDFLNYSIILTFIVLIIKPYNPTHSSKFNIPKTKYFIISPTLGIAFVFFQSILNIIYFQELSAITFNHHFNIQQLASFNSMTTILLVPITEELFFRKHILGQLLKKYKPALAIVLSAFLFAIIHLSILPLFHDYFTFDFHHAYIALFGGIIAGYLYYKSNALLPSILFHVFWNLTVQAT